MSTFNCSSTICGCACNDTLNSDTRSYRRSCNRSPQFNNYPKYPRNQYHDDDDHHYHHRFVLSSEKVGYESVRVSGVLYSMILIMMMIAVAVVQEQSTTVQAFTFSTTTTTIRKGNIPTTNSRSTSSSNRIPILIQQQQEIQTIHYTFSQNNKKIHRHFSNLNDNNDNNDLETTTSKTASTTRRTNKGGNLLLRTIMGGVAIVGVMETVYITLWKLDGTITNNLLFCSSTDSNAIFGSDCSSILTSPASYIPGTPIPLSVLGIIAYSLTAFLALQPLLKRQQVATTENDDDVETNQLLLTSLTTAMGLFSTVLVSYTVGVLQESCLYCFLSAICSVTLMLLSWLGNNNTATSKNDDGDDISPTTVFSSSIGSGILAILAAIFVVSSNNLPLAMAGEGNNSATSSSGASTTTLLAAKNDLPALLPPQVPPPITTTSSVRSLELGKQLATLDTKFYGAFWCSHCYEQKQRLGKEVMEQYVTYIECDKDGYNNQRPLCKEKKIPGYPTWEINGQFYPGEQSIEELEDIITSIKNTNKKNNIITATTK